MKFIDTERYLMTRTEGNRDGSLMEEYMFGKTE